MTTLNISLPKKMAQEINRLTREKGYASRSELVRELLREKLAGQADQFQVFEKRPLSQIRNELNKSGKYNKEFVESVIKGLKESSVYADNH